MRPLIVAAAAAASFAMAPTAGAAGTAGTSGSSGTAGTFYITGGGDGHGIGMGQYGAYGYALHGKGYRWILGHYYQGTQLGKTSPTQVVRVLLASGSAGFSGANRAPGKRLNPSLTYAVRALASGRLALIAPGGKRVGTYAAPLRVTGPGPLDVAGHGAYRGALEFRPAATGGVQTVNAVDLEDYVRGVVSEEMPSGWSAEALKVQAVAARTYAITTDVSGNGFQLYPDTRSQMYGGVSAETASTNAAVAATRGQVVTYQGRAVVTYFSASSGGHTEDIQNVWLGSTPEPWLRGVDDPYDGAGGNPYHRWSYRMTMAAAAKKLGNLVKGQLIGIKVTKRGVSPRVVSAEVVGTKGQVGVTGPQLQQIFGLMSTYMSFSSVSAGPGTGSGGATFSPLRVAADSGLAGAFAGFEVPGPAPLAIHGRVFPAHGGTAGLQVERRRAWHTIGRVHISAGGAYSALLHHPGRYRVVWAGHPSPDIAVS
jgi:stage II sporulation protein D